MGKRTINDVRRLHEEVGYHQGYGPLLAASSTPDGIFTIKVREACSCPVPRSLEFIINGLEFTESSRPGIIGVIQRGMPIFNLRRRVPRSLSQHLELIVAYIGP